MSRERIICVLLLCLSSGTSSAQDEPDLSSLTFTPGPFSDDVLLAPPAAPELQPVDEASEDENRDRLRESVQELTDTITAEEAANGAWSSGLIAPLTSLAATYQELGEDILALGVLEQAKQVIRRNDGLHSLDQAAVVEQMIDSVEAAGQLGESANLQNALLQLALRNAGDPRAPSVLAAIADRQMDEVDEYLDSGRWHGPRELLPDAESTGWEPSTSKAGRHLAPPELARILDTYDDAIEEALADDAYAIGDSLASEAPLAETARLIQTMNDYVEEGPLPRNGTWEPELPTSDRDWAIAALRRARRLYSAAAQETLRSGNASYEDGEYWALQEQLVETYYFEVAHPELHPDRIRHPEEMIYLTSAAALETKVVDKLIQGASAVEVASALIELADWHLFCSRNEMALEKYQDAYDFLVAKDVPSETIASLFSPEVPIALPAFDSEAPAFDPARRYRGYIDVSIETGKFGQATEIELLEASPAVSDDIERRLRNHISGGRFRPRFIDDRAGRSDQFALRYYFDF